MLRIDGRRRAACDGITRRTLLEAAGAGLLGLSLPGVLARRGPRGRRPPSRARSVIFLYLFGGPSQLETFDLKPGAPEKIRGPYRPIASRTPGLLIGEHLPRLAGVSDKFCVVRSMTHPYNDHSGAAHYMQTGRMWQVPIGGGFNPTAQDWPAMGSVVEYLAQQSPGGTARPMPGYAVLPNSLGRLQEAGQYLRPGEHAGWLGRRYNPLTTVVDKKDLKDNPYFRDCTDDELTFAIEGLAAETGPRLGRHPAPRLAPGAVRPGPPRPRPRPAGRRLRPLPPPRPGAWPPRRRPASRWTSAASRPGSATPTAATCSARRPWSPAGWSRRACGS